MYFGPLNIYIVVILFVFGSPIGLWELSEYLHMRRAEQFPVRQGMIVQREEIRRFGGIPAGRLSVKTDGIQQPLIAITNLTFAQEEPVRVRFHFTGNPVDEIFLEGEGNPFWVAVFFLATPFLILGIWLGFRGRPGMEGIVE